MAAYLGNPVIHANGSLAEIIKSTIIRRQTSFQKGAADMTLP